MAPQQQTDDNGENRDNGKQTRSRTPHAEVAMRPKLAATIRTAAKREPRCIVPAFSTGLAEPPGM